MYYFTSAGDSYVIVLFHFLLFCAPSGLPAKDTFAKTP